MFGVYLDMFEQSFLIDHTGKQNTGAFAASFTAQILMAGVLIVGPLIFSHAMPTVHLSALVPITVRQHVPDLPAVRTQPSSARSGPAMPSRARLVFHSLPPTRQTSVISSPIDLPDSPIISDVGVQNIFPAGPVSAPTLVRSPDPPVATHVVVQEPEKPLVVSGGLQAAKLIKRIIPTYPEPARRMRVSGVVHLLGIIAKDGRIQRLQVLSGNPLLTKAAVDAVSQWVYSPTVLSGQFVEIEAPIDVVFTLQ